MLYEGNTTTSGIRLPLSDKVMLDYMAARSKKPNGKYNGLSTISTCRSVLVWVHRKHGFIFSVLTNKTLSSGTSKLNITFSSILLTQNQFNYSIKVYNSTRRLKYRKDKILTQNYSSYEEGYRILDIKDLTRPRVRVSCY